MRTKLLLTTLLAFSSPMAFAADAPPAAPKCDCTKQCHADCKSGHGENCRCHHCGCAKGEHCSGGCDADTAA